MNNKCGTCSLCCKLLGVPEMNSKPNEWCSKYVPGQGCSIYSERPATCRDFECGWLANSQSDTEDFRPDRIHMIVTGESKRLDAWIVHVDPSYPSAPDSKLGKRLLEGMIKSGTHSNIVLVMSDKRRYIGDERRLAQAFAKAEADFRQGKLKVLD